MTAEKSLGLVSMLDMRTVRAKIMAASWQEAVEIAGRVMVDAELVRKEYITAMKNTLRELGPYSVIAPGIAMPHARPEDGVIRAGFSLLTLKNSVEFGSSENDPVDIIIAFSASDKISHIQALKEISLLFSESTFVKRVRAAETNEHLLAIIRGFDSQELRT